MLNKSKFSGGEGRPSVDEIIAQTTSPIALPRRRGFDWIKLILLLAAVGLAIGWGTLYADYQKIKKAGSASEEAGGGLSIAPVNLSDEELTGHIARLMELPSGTSTIATVSDVENLAKRDPFFTRAQNGDKLLLFDKQAVLYRPTSDKIISCGPLNDSAASGQPAASGSTAAAAPVRLEIRNGTATNGLASQWKTKLSANTAYKVEKIGNASRDDYSTTYLVNLGGKDVSALEKQFGVTAVGQLPAGEAASSQDVVIIVSK